MARPRNNRCLRFDPKVTYFKPRGIPLKILDEVVLAADEVEALKLHEVDGLEQKAVADKMGVSQPTVARILMAAHKKVARALIEGKAIRIETR